MKVYFLEGKNVKYYGSNSYGGHRYVASNFDDTGASISSDGEIAFHHGGYFTKPKTEPAVPYRKTAKILKAVRAAVVHHIKKEKPRSLFYYAVNPAKLRIYQRGMGRAFAKYGYRLRSHPHEALKGVTQHTWTRP